MTAHTLVGGGRGEVATRDMKHRIAALRAEGRDVLTVLWERHQLALVGDGHTYEYASRPEINQ